MVSSGDAGAGRVRFSRFGPRSLQMSGAAVTFVLLGPLVLLAAAVLGIVLMVRASTPGPHPGRYGSSD